MPKRHLSTHFAFSFRKQKLTSEKFLQVTMGALNSCGGQSNKAILNCWETAHRNLCGFAIRCHLRHSVFHLEWNSPHCTLIIQEMSHKVTLSSRKIEELHLSGLDKHLSLDRPSLQCMLWECKRLDPLKINFNMLFCVKVASCRQLWYLARQCFRQLKKLDFFFPCEHIFQTDYIWGSWMNLKGLILTSLAIR